MTVAVADVPPTAPGLPARVRVTDYARGGLGLDEAPLEAGPTRTFALAAPARALALAGDGRWLYALDTDGRLWAFDLAGAPVDGHGSGAAYAPAVAAGVVAGSGRDAAVPRDAGTGVVLLAGGEGRPRVTALRLLLGGQSILAGDAAGG
ncbi:MAG: hypothetical protein MUF66_12015, partial [Gammaproteobacteria bacterium]|nr:hypothetical protein [Gammaproteobacteria bacterium]